jgi:hypothetical protein
MAGNLNYYFFSKRMQVGFFSFKEKMPYLKKCSVALISFVIFTQAPRAQFKTLPPGDNPRASVSEQVGLCDITFTYNRPGVKGRGGKIFGKLIPWGFGRAGVGTADSIPWRAGANENTTVNFSTDVFIGGKEVKAGKYSFFVAPYADGTAMVILNAETTGWGSFNYNPAKDVLRTIIKTSTLPHTDQMQERMLFEFSNQSENKVTVLLKWEYLVFPIKIETDYLKNQVDVYRQVLQGQNGFLPQSWLTAIHFCIARNYNLPEALKWAEYITSAKFGGGTRNFQTLKSLSILYDRNGQPEKAKPVFEEALAKAGENDLARYADELIAQTKFTEATALLLTADKKFPQSVDIYTSLVQSLSGMKEYKRALAFAKKAQPLCKSEFHKKFVETAIAHLKEGRGIE